MLKTLTSWLNLTRFIKYIQTFTYDFRYLEKHFPHSEVTEASVDFSINNARMYTVDGYICLLETPVQAIHLHYLKKIEKKNYHIRKQQDYPLYIAWSKKCFVLNDYICQLKRHFINATYKIDMNKNICGTVSRNTTILPDIILNSHSTEVYERFPLCVVFPGLSLNRN